MTKWYHLTNFACYAAALSSEPTLVSLITDPVSLLFLRFFSAIMSYSGLLSKRFCKSSKSLCMGFTSLMNANTSEHFYNHFMKQTLISQWKIKKKSWSERLVSHFPGNKKCLCLLLLHEHRSIHLEWLMQKYNVLYLDFYTLMYAY